MRHARDVAIAIHVIHQRNGAERTVLPVNRSRHPPIDRLVLRAHFLAQRQQCCLRLCERQDVSAAQLVRDRIGGRVLHIFGEEIDAIRTQVARETQFRGYGPLSTAASGVLAILVAGGQSLSQVAAAQHVSEADFRTKLIASLKPVLDKAVADKKLTSQQETLIVQRLQTAPLPLWTNVPKHQKPPTTGTPAAT